MKSSAIARKTQQNIRLVLSSRSRSLSSCKNYHKTTTHLISLAAVNAKTCANTRTADIPSPSANAPAYFFNATLSKNNMLVISFSVANTVIVDVHERTNSRVSNQSTPNHEITRDVISRVNRVPLVGLKCCSMSTGNARRSVRNTSASPSPPPFDADFNVENTSWNSALIAFPRGTVAVVIIVVAVVVALGVASARMDASPVIVLVAVHARDDDERLASVAKCRGQLQSKFKSLRLHAQKK